MQFPKLSPLQSRFAVSFGATLLLLLIYLSLNRPSVAYALDVDTVIEHKAKLAAGYVELEDDGILRSLGVQKRQDATTTNVLTNNEPQNHDIEAGITDSWVFKQDQIEGPHGDQGVGLPGNNNDVGDALKDGLERHELRRRQISTSVWITINTCAQPLLEGNDEPAQLRFFYSTTSNNEKPGPINGGTEVRVIGGFGMIELEASEDVYIGVAGPNSTGSSQSWNYQIAASNDAPFHSWSNETDLFFVDSDNHAALLITQDLSDAPPDSELFQEWMKLQPAPFGMFAHDQKDKSILGVSRSYCGLLNHAKVMANIHNIANNNVGKMTTRGVRDTPKEQFYVSALNASSTYYGWLAMSGNSTNEGNGVVGGGGRVWANMTFNTKSSSNCALLYNLTFCSEVAYAVPSNPKKYSPLDGVPELAAVYDTYAQSMYQYFDYSLQQVACNTTASAQYSLARNCDDCARAYKTWLCATTIPRCEDWDNEASYLQPRNMAQDFTNGTTPSWITQPDAQQQMLLNSVQSNSSRSPQVIDDVIKPGPYKEVMPCIDLCWDLVQSCPAVLGFGCPKGKYANMSYGVTSSNSAILSCSYPGAAYYESVGTRDHRVPGIDKLGLIALVLSIFFLAV